MDGLCELDGLKGYFPAVYKQNCPSITEAPPTPTSSSPGAWPATFLLGAASFTFKAGFQCMVSQWWEERELEPCFVVCWIVRRSESLWPLPCQGIVVEVGEWRFITFTCLQLMVMCRVAAVNWASRDIYPEGLDLPCPACRQSLYSSVHRHNSDQVLSWTWTLNRHSLLLLLILTETNNTDCRRNQRTARSFRRRLIGQGWDWSRVQAAIFGAGTLLAKTTINFTQQWP